MRFLKNNLVVQFSIVSFLVMASVAVILAIVLSDKIRSDAVDDLVDETIGSSSARIIRALTPEDLESPMTGDRYDRFHEFVMNSVISDRTARLKIWSADGTVIYSNNPSQVGGKYLDKENLIRALQGETPIEVKIPQDVDNDLEMDLGTLIEVYSPIVFPAATTPVGALEIYQYYQPTADRIASLRRWIFLGIGLGFLILYLTLVFIVWGGWKTINRQQAQLKCFNSELEAKVEERTRELAEAHKLVVDSHAELESIVKDTTEKLEKAHADLLESNRLAAIVELAGGIAHELRSPLTTIRNSVFYMKRKVSDAFNGNHKVKEFLDVMDEEVNRSDQIITRMIDFAYTPFRLAEAENIEEMIEETLAKIDHNGKIQVIKEIEGVLPHLPLDREMVLKALHAVLENAQESMPNGGQLRITAYQQGGQLMIEVRDNGDGIAAAELNKIFDPMFSTRNRGVGLGLPIANRVMKYHGGSLDVTSAQGFGTQVTFRLPLPALL